MVVDLKLPPIPSDLKHAGPFCTRAQEVRARDPIVCYWSLYYVAQLGVKRGQTPENQAFLAAVVEQLETMKRSLRNRRQITDEAAGSLYVRRFGYNVFNAAIHEDTHGQANRSTAKKFLAASYFLETLRVFGPLDAEVEETIKYARSKANDIVRVLRESATPAPGPPAVPGRATPNGYPISPSALSPQTNPVLLSGRPSTFASPAESPTAAARKAFPFQVNYPPPPTDAGSGSPVSPRVVQAPPPMFVNPRRQAQAQEITKPESVALPSSGSSSQIPLPEPTSPRKLQSPVRERSPLAYVGPTFARNAPKPPSPPPKAPTPVIKPPSPRFKPSSPKPPSPKPASPIKAPVPVPVSVTSPVIQQLPEEWPASSIVLTRPGGPAEWPQHALVSPSMGSTMSVDSAETFTSSQLRTVIKSASTAPRASSPVKSESAASTEQSDSEATETEDETDDDESVAESTLMPVLTVVDEPAPKLEIPGTQASGLVAVASPVVDDWAFGREMTEAIGKLTRTPASSRASPLSTSRASTESTSRASPLSASHASTASETPILASPDLEAETNGITPAVVIPQSPVQPSPTTPNMRNYSPSTISPVSWQHSFKSAAEVIDFSFSKFDRGQEPELVEDEEEIGSGSSFSSFSSGSEDEAEVEETKEDSESSDGSSISEMTIQEPEVKPQEKQEQNPMRKTVRFAPSVVGGLSPEIPKQILPPPPQPPRSTSSPPLQIVPVSSVPQPLVRPKSLTIRSSSYDSYQPAVRSPDSPMYGPSRPPVDGEFAIIPFHPSMSASHPAPAVHNNPAYAPTANNALVRTTWTSSPTQGPSVPPHRVQVDRETASLAQKYSRFAISSLNYMDIEAAKKELRAALTLLEGGDMY